MLEPIDFEAQLFGDPAFVRGDSKRRLILSAYRTLGTIGALITEPNPEREQRALHAEQRLRECLDDYSIALREGVYGGARSSEHEMLKGTEATMLAPD